MAISDRSRKILWARAGGRCSICRVLVVTEGTATDDPSVFGQEAHIVSAAATGPRAGDLPDHDSYENLILLCAKDHKRVDDQVVYYSIDLLRQIKRDHEVWTASLPQPDSRWANFIGGISPDGRIRPMSHEMLAGLADEWADLVSDSIPIDGPAELLCQARSLFVKSWFDYEFMVTACLIGFQAMEAAFRVLYPEAEQMPFRALIRRARDEGVLPENIADLADAGAELLNLFSHPKGRAALTLGAAAPMLENTHRMVALVMAAAGQRDAVRREARQPKQCRPQSNLRLSWMGRACSRRRSYKPTCTTRSSLPTGGNVS